MEGRAERSKKQTIKKDLSSLERGCITDIIHPVSFLLGRGSKQTMEMPFIVTTCLTMNMMSPSQPDSRYSDTTCQTLNPKRYSISRLDPKFLRALQIAFGLLFRYLCNIVSIFQAHVQRYGRKEEVIFLSFHMCPLGQE